MADPKTCLPLTAESIQLAHKLIKPYIHQTPLLTSKSLNQIASQPQFPGGSSPRLNLFFKCENQQRIGAFKARGAHHAILRLIESIGLEEVRKRGVCTHSSGNHAQALALAASTFSIPAYIVMPTISAKSKIAGTRQYTEHVIFSGSTSDEREAKVAEVMEQTGAILVPPYEHPDIILGQGTAGFELQRQYHEIVTADPQRSAHPSHPHLDALISPLGGGGLLSGLAVNFSTTTTTTSSPSSPTTTKKTQVFGAEPSFSGADDAVRGLASSPPQRIAHVSSLTIADGLRTPVGEIPWSIISDTNKCAGVFAVTEDQIRLAMRLVLERLKVWVEPSAVVGLAVILFCEEWRQLVPKGDDGGWDVAVVLTGGNTTVEAVVGLFGGDLLGEEKKEEDEVVVEKEREQALVGVDGERKAEDVAG